MSTFTVSNTFTRTHAKELAAKVIADLNECAIFYGSPSIPSLPNYEAELIELLAGGYVDKYEFGFKKGDQRIVAWRYTVGSDGALSGSGDSPGKLYAKGQITGATYYNFLTFSSKWIALTPSQQEIVEGNLPFKRGDGSLPGSANGYWTTDNNYSAGGTRLARETFRS
jgi:hypothetical protein